MNLTEQMQMRDQLAALRVLRDRIPPTRQNADVLRNAEQVIELGERMLSVIECTNCDLPLAACQCEHTSAGRAA